MMIRKWLSRNKISLNVDKTKHHKLDFNVRNVDCTREIIQKFDEVKLLGYVLDFNLK